MQKSPKPAPALTEAQIKLMMAERYQSIILERCPSTTALLASEAIVCELRLQVANSPHPANRRVVVEPIQPGEYDHLRLVDRLIAGAIFVASYALIYWLL